MKLLGEKDGYKWTQMTDIDIKERIFVSKIYLANSAQESDWKQITDAEAELLQEQQETAYEVKLKQRVIH